MDAGCVLLTAGGGCGKTTIIGQALAETSMPAAWISCSDTERSAGALLMRILDRIARAVPGASDALAERLAAAPEQVDAIAATRELLDELPRLLVEPLVLVIDDAEHLDGADDAVRVLDELVRAEGAPLRVAVASRRSLDLRVAKPRAAGLVTELKAADLAFDPEECAAALLARGLDPSPDQVEQVMEATEGWPLGVAIATALAESRGGGPDRGIERMELRSAPDLKAYLAEELLESLDAELREATISASVSRVVTPEVAQALGLPADFGRRVERAGMLVRRLDDSEAFTYHPLLRELLLDRLTAERGKEERWRLNAAVAPVVAAAGDSIEAIHHWLAAEAWEEAVAAIEREGPALVRTSPDLMWRWLSLLPDEVRSLPTIQSLEGQLEWGAGDHPSAIEALGRAISGFRTKPNPPAEWMSRFVLVDSLQSTGEFDRVIELVDGWDAPEAEAAGFLAPATVVIAAVAMAAAARFEQSDRLAEMARQHPQFELLAPIDAIRLAFHDTPLGELDRDYARMEAAARQLEVSDPFNRRFYLVSSLAIMLADRGRREDALRKWLEVREGSRGGAAPFLVDTTHAWRGLLHAQAGRLQEAEDELAHHEGLEKSWRVFVGDLARACVASLQGDAERTVVLGDRALATIASGPVIFRYWAGADLVPPLVAVGRVDRAWAVLDETLALVDERFPGPLGRFPRGRLVALRGWLRHAEGDVAGSDDDLRLFWRDAGETLRHTLRREWERLDAPVWGALERGALRPDPTVEAISRAFPEGLKLVPFLDHPVADVRRAAIAPAIGSGDPDALARLDRLADDPDPAVARAASAAIERLPRSLPPLRFEVLGPFAVRRAAWRAEGAAWGRPVDARVVRFLLVNRNGGVPEDLIFDALWPESSPASARRGLQVAVSRARRVLDPPGAEHSVIESAQSGYRLALGERDTIDAEEFDSAAELALGEGGEQRRRLLERARALWGGDPIPEERYSDWATAYRERLIDRHIAVLTGLVEIHERVGEHAEAADVAHELIGIDVLNERAHRALIAAYARAGRTGQALRQYLECRRALVDGLGVEPSEATSRLQARILAGEAV